MATDSDFIDYIHEQAGLEERLTHKRMFGEYGIYLDGKVVAFACDNSLFLKPTDAARVLLPLAWVQQRWPEAGFAALATGTIFGVMYAYLVRFCAVALQSVEAGYERIPRSVDDTALLLGTGTLRVFGRLHLPLLKRSVFAALLLVFVDVMKELPATLLLRPFGSDTLAVVAYNFARDERLAEAALPSLAIVAVGLIPVLLLSKAMRSGDAP